MVIFHGKMLVHQRVDSFLGSEFLPISRLKNSRCSFLWFRHLVDCFQGGLTCDPLRLRQRTFKALAFWLLS